MSVFLRLEDLFIQCLTNDSLRKVLRKNEISILGDFEDKVQRLSQAVLARELRFREDLLHQLQEDEIREISYQLGFDTDGPLWKIKEDILFWFDQNFDGLSGWDDRDRFEFSGQDEILEWVKTGSLGQIQKLCFYIENYLDDQGLLHQFSIFETKEEGIQRLSGISPRIVMEAAGHVLESQEKYEEEVETPIDLNGAYKALGIQADEPASLVKKRYRELMKQWHPDAMGTSAQYDANCMQKLHIIQDAFQKIKSVRPDVR